MGTGIDGKRAGYSRERKRVFNFGLNIFIIFEAAFKIRCGRILFIL